MRELLFLTLANWLPRLKMSDRFRYAILRVAGIEIHGRATIWAPIVIRPIGGAKNIEIGAGTFINSEVRFAAPVDKIRIGGNCAIGPRVCFETVNHGLKYVVDEGRGTETAPINIEDEVWIGAGSIILPGVTVGRGSVIAAGAVVTGDVPENVIYGGVPAKFIRNV